MTHIGGDGPYVLGGPDVLGRPDVQVVTAQAKQGNALSPEAKTRLKRIGAVAIVIFVLAAAIGLSVQFGLPGGWGQVGHCLSQTPLANNIWIVLVASSFVAGILTTLIIQRILSPNEDKDQNTGYEPIKHLDSDDEYVQKIDHSDDDDYNNNNNNTNSTGTNHQYVSNPLIYHTTAYSQQDGSNVMYANNTQAGTHAGGPTLYQPVKTNFDFENF